MKRRLAMAVVFLFLLSFTGFTFAQDNEHKSTKATEENMEIIRGKVVSVDTASKTITVADSKSQTNKTFTVTNKAIAVVKVGDTVTIKVKVGSTDAKNLKIGKSEEKKEKEEAGEKAELKGGK